MISRQHKAIFIHIEKTGGTSIEKKLGLFEILHRGVQDHRKLRQYEHLANTAFKFNSLKFSLYNLRRHNYRKALYYLKNTFLPELTKTEYETFYKFTFVRNTWDRIYSYYLSIIRDEIVRKIYNIKTDCSFKHFIEHFLDHKNFNQLNYIKDIKGNISVDYIGRFENLQNDFDAICKILKIEDTELPKLLVFNKVKDYTQFYNHETMELVYKLYKDEIDYFDFEFGN